MFFQELSWQVLELGFVEGARTMEKWMVLVRTASFATFEVGW